MRCNMCFRFIYLILLALVLTIITGCSGAKSPVLPSGSGEKADSNFNPISESNNPDQYFNSGILGVYSGYIDPITLTGELSPLRASANKDVLEVVDITNFLSMAPCSNCVKIHSVSLDADNHITANIGIRHPFPVGDPLKPPSQAPVLTHSRV
jgi:hypothetical protein